ncbi:MAG: 2-succinyl-6-hydroxy-2,4-cyclohexadiene-1-carboxylate synthase [Balneolales bacterium]
MITQIRGVKYYIDSFHINDALPNLIMLHGFMGSSGSFFHLIDALNEVANVILIDLLGHGETEAPIHTDRYSAEEQTADLKEIINEYGPNIILHGYSMGGRLALQFACTYPGLVNSLILESTTAGIVSQEERIRRRKKDAILSKRLMENKELFIEEWNQLPLFENITTLPADIDAQITAIQQVQNPVGLNNSLLGFGTGKMPPLQDSLPDVDIPCLILAGANDAKFIDEGKYLSNKITGCRYIEIEKASHRIHLDNPDAYLMPILDFIKKLQR